MWAGGMTMWAAQSQTLCAAACRRYPPRLSAARPRDGGSCLVGNAGPRRAQNAADRRNDARRLGGQRFRRPRLQHHRHGGRSDRARHRRGRQDLAAVLALRPGLGGRRRRPRRGPGALLDAPHPRASGRAVQPPGRVARGAHVSAAHAAASKVAKKTAGRRRLQLEPAAHRQPHQKAWRTRRKTEAEAAADDERKGKAKAKILALEAEPPSAADGVPADS